MAGRIDTIVFVHGAFADGSSWRLVIADLFERGHRVIAVQNPLTSLADDVAATRRAIERADGNVLLCGHSWGGAVISEAGNHPKVAGLVYVCAGAPDSGGTFDSWWKEYPPGPGVAEIGPWGDDGFVAMSREGMRQFYAGDLPDAEADILHATQVPLALRCFSDPVTHAAWRDKPCWYVVNETDQTVPPAAQSDAARRMEAEVLTVRSSHVPMLSQPAAVAAFIAGAAASFG